MKNAEYYMNKSEAQIKMMSEEESTEGYDAIEEKGNLVAASYAKLMQYAERTNYLYCKRNNLRRDGSPK